MTVRMFNDIFNIIIKIIHGRYWSSRMYHTLSTLVPTNTYDSSTRLQEPQISHYSKDSNLIQYMHLLNTFMATELPVMT
jgi:hypothetical protein